ncbi:MAG TPA: hypothetical protein PLS08_15045, partial [Chryseolinea sp.]|nr:hypothetical protein [Chryseolinea sp.]
MKKMYKLVVLLGFLTIPNFTLAQEYSRQNIGVGLGIDYGGIGAKFTFLPVQKFGFFGSLGYNLIGLGFNAGATYRFIPTKSVCPTLGAMYGYNGVIKVEGGNESNKIYYGPSFSAGVELKSRGSSNFWNFELILPLRPSK